MVRGPSHHISHHIFGRHHLLFIRPVQCHFFSNMRLFLLPHDLPILNTMTETTRGIITIEASHRESLNEVASPQRLGSFGLPRCESPEDYWPGPDLEGGVQEPKTSSEGKFGVKDEL
jgi:hypothetical protein